MLKAIQKIIIVLFILFLSSCSAFRDNNSYFDREKLIEVNKFRLKIEYKNREEKSKIRAIFKEGGGNSSLFFLTPLNKVVVKIDIIDSKACIINLKNKRYALGHIDNLLYDLWGLHIKYKDFVSLLKGKKVYIEDVKSVFDSNKQLKSIILVDKQIYVKIDINNVKKIKTVMKKEKLSDYRMVEIKDVFK